MYSAANLKNTKHYMPRVAKGYLNGAAKEYIWYSTLPLYLTMNFRDQYIPSLVQSTIGNDDTVQVKSVFIDVLCGNDPGWHSLQQKLNLMHLDKSLEVYHQYYNRIHHQYYLQFDSFVMHLVFFLFFFFFFFELNFFVLVDVFVKDFMQHIYFHWIARV